MSIAPVFSVDAIDFVSKSNCSEQYKYDINEKAILLSDLSYMSSLKVENDRVDDRHFPTNSLFSVRFSENIIIILIPTREELQMYFDNLFYKAAEYDIFKRDAIHEVKSLMKTENLSPKDALTNLYQSNIISGLFHMSVMDNYFVHDNFGMEPFYDMKDFNNMCRKDRIHDKYNYIENNSDIQTVHINPDHTNETNNNSKLQKKIDSFNFNEKVNDIHSVENNLEDLIYEDTLHHYVHIKTHHHIILFHWIQSTYLQIKSNMSIFFSWHNFMKNRNMIHAVNSSCDEFCSA